MNNADFDAYKDQCLEDISSLQNAFIELYDINRYEHWFYDHDIGVFQFRSDDGRNLYFKYVDVGSFSSRRNTWMWSWCNKSTPPQVTHGLEKVRSFGATHDYLPLTEGFHEQSDEYMGWAFAAIAATLLSGIGVYRAPDEHRHIYFVFTNELTQEEYDALLAEKEKRKYVECGEHGTKRRVAFVCQHLHADSNAGFYEAFESDPNVEPEDDYQAWCDACELERRKEGAWNERSEVHLKIRIVCDECFFEIKRNNQRRQSG
jgi:hypothetical protein